MLKTSVLLEIMQVFSILNGMSVKKISAVETSLNMVKNETPGYIMEINSAMKV